ncbi:MAG TPA: hypothetical protein PKX27_03905 [Bacteroidales bacterium]|nr:hypothetical protein [Bacteroidales bacterium]HOX73186.1 hypothetical protein [Bacteroidales bacterium]HPM87103.1 hypothetical protein [Bacteroidales bacterium]HQM68746.1 hypothetical protein [Bacteroidales bacterium]
MNYIFAAPYKLLLIRSSVKWPKLYYLRIYLLFNVLTFQGLLRNLPGQTFSTPDVFSYKQEVFSSVSYYTGQADVTIPLFEIQTPEITIPVSLKYIGGEGLRPINPYSSVGFGWKLSAGGAITRTVNEEPDEFNTPGTGRLLGFFNLPANSVNNEYVRNSAYTFLQGTDHTSFISQYEYSPDIFSFSFLGYSGYFVMGYDKTFKIQSQDIVKVEKYASNLINLNNTFYFKLTANDGTKFTFGSEEGSVELSGGVNYTPYQSLAWYLTRIEFPTGRNISFTYQPNIDIHIRFRTSEWSDKDFGAVASPVVLKNIIFNGGKVSITSEKRPHKICESPDYARIIDKIELRNPADQKVSSVILKYSPKVSNRYYILDSLRVDDKRYSFGYNSAYLLPDFPQSCGTDYWGFYNGQPELTGRIQPGLRDPYLNQNLTLPAKMPSSTHSQLGILTSVTYPTGDSELFEYESHTYSYSNIQTLSSYYNSFSEEPKIAGGLRIAKITLGNQIRKYKYVNTFDPNNPDYIPGSMSYIGFSSSGILYKFPAVSYMTAEALNFLSIEGEPPVTYSRVIESLSDKSYTVYDMYSALDRPEGQNNQNENYYACTANLPAIFNFFYKYIFVGALSKSSSCALERGHIKEIRFYDSSNTLKRTIAYTYSSNPGRYNQYVSSIYLTDTSEQRMAWLAFELGLQYLNNSALSFVMLHSYCIYTFPVYLEEEKITDYYGSQSITNTTRYRYNNKRLKSAVITYNSRGDSLKTIIRYPSDINTGVYANMNTLNMINFPVEQITLKNNKYTGSKLTTYKAVSSTNYAPDKIYSLEITYPLTSFTYYNGTSRDSHYGIFPEITYDIYSNTGNIRQMTGRDETPISYLWDASGIYSMAQVRGATYSQIQSYDGKAGDYSSITLWTGLKNNFNRAQFSTYSYKLLTGIATATNIPGVTTNYTYDLSRRLFMVRDDDKNILSLHRFGFRNYPDNGLGGYSPVTAYLSKPSYVIKGNLSSGKVTVSGGSGSFSYNWYLKTSSGALAASSTNSSSDVFYFTCSQTGTFYIQCEITDNLLGKKITCYTGNFTCCVSVCSFDTNTGFSKISGSAFNFGTTASVSFTFCTTYIMQPNVTYLVGFISSGCCPSGTRTFNIDSVMGRSWEVTITQYGYVYWRMACGTEMYEYECEDSGTLTYNL